jgi:hypothetical protein
LEGHIRRNGRGRMKTGQTSPLLLEAFILGLMSGFDSTLFELSVLPPLPPPTSPLTIALVEGLMSLALGLVGSRVLVPSSGIRSAYKLSYRKSKPETKKKPQTNPKKKKKKKKQG